MKEFEYDEFVIYLTGVAMTFDKEIRAEQIEIYFETLKDDFVNIEEFKKVARKVMRTWKYSYMPKPAHFLEKSKNYTELDLEIIAKKAGKVFAEAIESVGRYTIPEFEDPIIAMVIDMLGGWVECCNIQSYEKLSWLKKEFEKVYKQVVEKGNIKQIALLPAAIDATTKKVSCDYEIIKLNQIPVNNALENKGVQLAVGYKKF